MKKDNRIKKTEFYYALLHVGYWGGNVTALSFALAYLKDHGIGDAQAGYIFAFYNLGGFLLSNIISYIVDGRKIISSQRILTFFLSVEAAMLILLIFCDMSAALTAIVYLMYMMNCLPVLTLITKLYTDAKQNGINISFANARWKGSLSFAMISVLVGWLVNSTEYMIIPVVGLALVGIQLCGVFFYCMHVKAACNESIADVTSEKPDTAYYQGNDFILMCRQYPRFIILVLGIGLVLSTHKTLNGFMFNAVIGVGGNPQILGLLTFFTSAVEILAMLMFQRCRIIRLSSLLMISLICFPIRLLLMALADSVFLLFAASSLQLMSFGLYTPTIVEYVNKTISFENSAKAQGLIITAPALASFLINVMTGQLFEILPVKTTLMFLMLISAFGVGLCVIGIDRKA